MGEKQNLKPQRKWPRVLIGIGVGILVAGLDYYYHHSPQDSLVARIVEWLSRGIVSAVASALLLEVWAFSRQSEDLSNAVSSLTQELDSFKDRVFTDERIIFARPQLSKGNGKPVLVLGIENVDPVPEALSYTPQSGGRKWTRSISILRFDRIQDLLFSRDYLKHFFSLRHKTKTTSRILIINDRPRSTDAVRSFLQISEQFGIHTFVYRKSEFYGMLECLNELLPDDANAIREVLNGNPELNIMVKEESQFKEWMGGTTTIEAEAEYILRYLTSGERREVVTRAPGARGSIVGTIPSRHVKWVLRLMAAALKESRRGVSGFERIISDGQNPENYWSCRNLRSLKANWE